METTKKSKGFYWLIFFLSLAVMIFMLATPSTRQWFWLILPFVCTSFALGMDIM